MPLSPGELTDLVNTLATGFETLFSEVLNQKNLASDLRERLDGISCENLNKPPHSNHDANEPTRQDLSYDSEDPIQKAYQALRTIRMPQLSDVPLNARKCPVTNKTTDQEDFEHDFTTQGKAGSLECPFARMAQNRLPITPDSQIDPLAAEFHQTGESAALEENERKAKGQCPIRFLDQHSPEELARYFENHKHEIPRSHEVCVRRYQQNEQGIRQLDAKYGTLVNMIQGLGVKHKQYLPKKGELQSQGSQSAVALDRWADDVDERSHPGQPESDDGVRESHFQRPLREVRVGESPSRPWGIPVPLDKEIAPSAPQSMVERDETQRRREGNSSLAKATETLAANKTLATAETPKETFQNERKHPPGEQPIQTQRPQVVFSGPVFIGYSADEAARFLQNLNLAQGIPENQ